MTSRDDREDDIAFDREVESLLSVEPSPAFQARIRARLASETFSGTAGGWWERAAWPAAFAAVASVVLIVSATLWFGYEPRDQQAPIAASHPQEDEAPPVQRSIPPAPEAEGSNVSPPVPPVRASDVLRTGVQVSVEPPIQVVEMGRLPRDPFRDVLVSASEVRAVQQVAALLSREDLSKAPPPSPAPEGINELVIAPITVAPIQLRPIEGEAE